MFNSIYVKENKAAYIDRSVLDKSDILISYSYDKESIQFVIKKRYDGRYIVLYYKDNKVFSLGVLKESSYFITKNGDNISISKEYMQGSIIMISIEKSKISIKKGRGSLVINYY
ncbi:MAG: hypothetical protein ARM1_0663 [Candidatus Micrarchaeota archaeon]|nr:MAG: hypothetical protein ARM1_0663 [Candidatus Micrarchaeota archaeon]